MTKFFLYQYIHLQKNLDKIQRGVEIGLLWNKNMNLLIPIQKKFLDENILLWKKLSLFRLSF